MLPSISLGIRTADAWDERMKEYDENT